MMYSPKKDLYDLLSTTGIPVYQTRPELEAVFPCITYLVADNKVIADLDKEIGYQTMVFNIDIWAKTSSESTELLGTVEELLRGQGYILSSSNDLVDLDGYSHIATRFNFIH